MTESHVPTSEESADDVDRVRADVRESLAHVTLALCRAETLLIAQALLVTGVRPVDAQAPPRDPGGPS
jgi:hypothetical protein